MSDTASFEPGTHLRVFSPSGRQYGEVVMPSRENAGIVVGNPEMLGRTFAAAALWMMLEAKDRAQSAEDGSSKMVDGEGGKL